MLRTDSVVLAHKPSRFPSAFLVTRGSILSPFLAAVAAAFIAFGVAAWKESDSISSVTAMYSAENKYQYLPADETKNINMKLRNFTVGSVTHQQGSKARINFTIRERMDPPVYLYYTMTNFYQSISYFHDGRNSEQLAGLTPSSSFLYRCDPFRRPGYIDNSLGTSVTVEGKKFDYSDFLYYPCGTAAWSMFNDTFALYKINDGSGYELPSSAQTSLDTTKVTLVCNASDFDARGAPLGGSYAANLCGKEGISRKQDVEKRFKPLSFALTSWTPRYPYNTTDPFLKAGWYAGEPGHSLPDPEDLDFQVWMASAPTRNFRKLHRIIHTPLTPGVYVLEVDEFFDSYSYGGTKGIQLRTVQSWLVERNYPLAGCYIGLGIASFIASVVVGVKAFTSSRKDAKEIAEQEAREANGEDDELPAATAMMSRLTGETEEERSSAAAARKRWYTFDIHSEHMRQYVELRREREDIRKWQLEHMTESAADNLEDEGDEQVEEGEEVHDEEEQALRSDHAASVDEHSINRNETA